MNNPNNSSLGKIELICGCVYSGKTTELIRRINHLKIGCKEVLVFQPHKKNKNNKFLYTHDNNRLNAETILTNYDYFGDYDNQNLTSADMLSRYSTIQLKEILEEESKNVKNIAIDDIHLFDSSIIKYLEILANKGNRVILAGLDLDYMGYPYPGPITDIIAKCDDLVKLTAICEYCNSQATKSLRIINGKVVTNYVPEYLISPNERYVAVCHSCFYNIVMKS
jgi:thymidine kinase